MTRPARKPSRRRATARTASVDGAARAPSAGRRTAAPAAAGAGAAPHPAGHADGPAGRASSAHDPAGRRPAALAVLCTLVVLQAGALVGLAVVWTADLVRGASQLPAATVFLVAFALGVAAVLVLAARGLWAGRRWARSPVMTWQVLLVVMAVGWLGSDPTWWVVLVLVSAVLVGVGLHLPRVVAATVGRADG